VEGVKRLVLFFQHQRWGRHWLTARYDALAGRSQRLRRASGGELQTRGSIHGMLW